MSRRTVYGLLVLVLVLGWLGGSRLFGSTSGLGRLFFASDGSGDQTVALGASGAGAAVGGSDGSGGEGSSGNAGTVSPPMRIDIPSIGVSSSLLRLGAAVVPARE